MELTATRLALRNFRSYELALVEFSERTVIVGPNASGKTNLLEALFLLASGKSFRADRELEMIAWGQPAARVEAAYHTIDGERRAAVTLTPGGRGVKKEFALDGRKQPRRALPAALPTVLFSADDVRLVDGSPGRRRRALDVALGQSSWRYREDLSRYGRVVAARNRLLEQVASGEAGSSELDFWDTELVTLGTAVMAARREFITQLNSRLPEAYRALTKSSPDPAKTMGRLRIDYQTLADDLAAEMPRRRRQDLAVGTTTAGPHRDDWTVLLDNRPLSSFGSGGEYRSAMLAIRLAETAWLTEQSGITPLLLLDDVFSELDAFRHRALLAALPVGQTIITTPELGSLADELGGDITELRLPLAATPITGAGRTDNV